VLGAIHTKAATLINTLESVWFSHWPWGDNWILCDQLAMVAAIEKEAVIQSSEHVVSVELSGSLTRGMMVVDQRVDTLQDTEVRRNVRIIERLDIQLLQHSLLRAFLLDG